MVHLPLIRRFLEHLDGERNFSVHTLRGYAGDLTQFCQFLSADPGAAVALSSLSAEVLSNV